MSTGLALLFQLSFSAAVTALVVLALRLLLKPAPKKYSCLLWLAVFFRALCPLSFSSHFSLFNFFGFLGTQDGQLVMELSHNQSARLAEILAGGGEQAAAAYETVAAGMAEKGGAGSLPAVLEGASVAGNAFLMPLLFSIWILGVAVLVGYSIAGGLRLKRQIALAVRNPEGYYESDQIAGAFVLGFFRPRIFLPKGLSKPELTFVLEHERMHLKRQDHRLKLLAWLITILHWFNPLMWLSFILFTRDMEMACDERVLEKLGPEQKKKYGNFLFSLATPSKFPAGSPLAFGESSVKARICNVIRYKRKGRLVAGGALCLVLAAFILCLSNPVKAAMAENREGDAFAEYLGAFPAGDAQDTEEPYAEVKLFVQNWANAVADQDADTAYQMLSPALQSRAEELGIDTFEDGSHGMGWSSPFVVSDIEQPLIYLYVGSEADMETVILYPAITTDPSWWVWKDYLRVEETQEGYQIAEWEQRTFFQITSCEEFQEAYECELEWRPDYIREFSEIGSFAELLQQHLDEDTNSEYYSQYLNPVQAMQLTLHLDGLTSTWSSVQEDGSVLVQGNFEDGYVTVRMVQPVTAGSGGVWVPDGDSFETTRIEG